MSFRRKCTICCFVGIDDDFFTKNKKICDSCINNKKQDRENKKNESKSKKIEYQKKWRDNNKEYQKNYLTNWMSENPDKMKEYRKKAYLKNKENRKGINNLYFKYKRINDPFFKLKMNLRNLIKNGLTKQGYTKKSKTYEIIGISYDDFRKYIESKFLDGMNWDNYGKWHLDHIIPMCSATSEIEAISLCHYENFQPLWAIDNQIKGGKIL